MTRHRCRVQHVIFAKGSSLASYRFFLYAVAIILNTMDEIVLNDLQKLKLTKEEGEEICITSTNQSNLLEECSLSLFGKLLSDRHQNSRALKNTFRMAWKLGSDLRIVDVGNGILQFKFSSRFQMEWVEKSGLWNFENYLLLLYHWKAGLISTNIVFTHSPFWVQV